MPHPKAPNGLSEASKRLWGHVLSTYELDEHHLRVLTVALEAWDRKEEARRTLKKEGLVFHDRFGAPRKHPAVSIEENARLAFLRCMRELDLDGEPEPTPRQRRRR